MAVVAARCNDCINFIGSSRAPDARAVAFTSAGEPNLRVARVPGMALVVNPVCQAAPVDEEQITGFELIERQRQGLRSRGVASARHGKWRHSK